MRVRHLKLTLITLSALTTLGPGGCRDETPAPVENAPAPPAASTPAATDCAGLSRTHCMEEPGCTLELRPSISIKNANGSNKAASPGYVCRPAVGPCETGVNQARLSGADGADSSQDAILECNGLGKCTAQPGECFCPCHGHGETKVPDGHEAPTCQCRCSGGPPPVCSPY